MFYQVRVPPQDCGCLRFYWWKDSDLTQELVHLFGAVSSPSCSNAALLQTAEDNQRQFEPSVVETVKNNFYVDDCLASVPDEETAAKRIQNVSALCQKGGFRVTKWLSNSKDVIETIPKEERASEVKDINLELETLPNERALGVVWIVESDQFGFKVQKRDDKCTRRTLLYIVSSLYDPLGFVSPFVLPAKLILQELCRLRLDWDDGIPDKHLKVWNQWLNELPQPETLKLSRCLNPADPASRGLNLEAFIKCEAWFHGPKFLQDTEVKWPNFSSYDTDLGENDPEVKKSVNSALCEPEENEDFMMRAINYSSSWTKLKKIIGWILVAKENLRSRIQGKGSNSKQPSKPTALTSAIQKQAESCIIMYVQSQHFKKELKALTEEKDLSHFPKTLQKLDPIVVDGILRVGGRLSQAPIPYDAKHPVLLPKDSAVSMLILREIHEKIGHMGKNANLAKSHEQYWILGAGTLTRQLTSKCVVCRKYRAKVKEQQMADLPQARLTLEEPPFTRVGIDYFGPFQVKRGRALIMRYGVVFTCMAMRAVHLEIAHTMDTDSAICCIRRFIARRGKPKDIFSDNGTNFIGSNRELQEEINKWEQAKIQGKLAQEGITWVFNPPDASHHGGVWERLIRSVRKVLYGVVHQQSFHFDDECLSTIFCEVEAILNGRPLTRLPNEPSELSPLTPNHLLLLRSSETAPPVLSTREDLYSKRRWKQVQFIVDQFWKRWSGEYLVLLQERQKWCQPQHNVAVNDIVLVIDNSPRNSWCLGRITEVMPDRKGQVRTVRVKTSTTELLRPITKICTLLEDEI